jgi:hypothetical protein
LYKEINGPSKSKDPKPLDDDWYAKTYSRSGKKKDKKEKEAAEKLAKTLTPTKPKPNEFSPARVKTALERLGESIKPLKDQTIEMKSVASPKKNKDKELEPIRITFGNNDRIKVIKNIKVCFYFFLRWH